MGVIRQLFALSQLRLTSELYSLFKDTQCMLRAVMFCFVFWGVEGSVLLDLSSIERIRKQLWPKMPFSSFWQSEQLLSPQQSKPLSPVGSLRGRIAQQLWH